jgi:hypothetical protein
MCDGCKRLLTIREWPDQTRERQVSTWANQELKPLPVHKPVEGKETRVATKKRPAIPKYSSISVIRDFPPILRRFNPHLSDGRKQAMHTHLTQISDEYTRMELEEI